MKSDRGMSLVEVLAVLLLLTIVISPLYLLWENEIRSWYLISEETDLRNRANTAMASIQKDLLSAQIGANGESAIVLYDQNNVVVTSNFNNPYPKIGIWTNQSHTSGVTYQFRSDGLYRGVPGQAGTGTLVGLGGVDFSGSSFSLSENLVVVHLQVRGPHGSVYSSDFSSRYLFK